MLAGRSGSGDVFATLADHASHWNSFGGFGIFIEEEFRHLSKDVAYMQGETLRW